MAAGTVPALSILWVMDDHTGGPPTPDAEQADNDLAIGRIIDYISHSNVWSSSAIFIEEDDAQNGVDHVDGHRSPGYIISPYAVQNGTCRPHLLHAGQHDADDRANPRSDAHEPVRPGGVANDDGFRPGHAAQEQLPPLTHVPNQVPLDQGVAAGSDRPHESRKIKRPTDGLAQEEEADLRRQTDQARRRRPGHRQPSELVHGHWV